MANVEFYNDLNFKYEVFVINNDWYWFWEGTMYRYYIFDRYNIKNTKRDLTFPFSAQFINELYKKIYK